MQLTASHPDRGRKIPEGETEAPPPKTQYSPVCEETSWGQEKKHLKR